MEAIGFAVSLTGLITVFDKACEIWRAISAARDFGDDVEDSIRKLEIEFFRFQSWWTAVQRLEALPVCSTLLLRRVRSLNEQLELIASALREGLMDNRHT